MENTLVQNDLLEVREGFNVNDLEGATWVFRKLRAIEDKQAELKVIAEKEIARISTWLEKETSAYEGDKLYFEGVLTEYYISQRAADKKFKLTTPYGKVTVRKSKKWTYTNEDQLIKYLKHSNPELIRTKEELNKADIKKIFKDGVNKETGEVLPFVTIDDAETISVSVE